MVYALARASAFLLYLMDYVMLIGIYVYRNTNKITIQQRHAVSGIGSWREELGRRSGGPYVCVCMVCMVCVCVCVCVWLRRVCVCVCACLLK
jgi:hypothetical protein